MRILNQWHNLSISKKLYGVIGVMAVLIVLELLTLWFAMNTLSAVRAFVGGEGLWSKAQKDAAASLQQYVYNGDEKNYEAFLNHLKINEGDHKARIELEKPNPDFNKVREGFLEGGNHPEDIDAMIKLLRRYYNIFYIREAIVAWSNADKYLAELRAAGSEYHQIIHSKKTKFNQIQELSDRIKQLNAQLTVEENRFSQVLGEGSRWLENLIIGLLSFAVLMVEGVGLSLAFYTSRSISRGLNEITEVASDIGHGNFSRRVNVTYKDEIGTLGNSLNQMGEMLQKSYSELEARVEERTAELAKAVRARDEFLSIASHELKTPLTSLNLQTQVRRRMLNKNDNSFVTRETIEKMVTNDEKQVSRLINLVDDILDISRLTTQKFHLNKTQCDLSHLVKVVVERFALNFQNAACTVTTDFANALEGEWDASRIEQVIENLLTNAMKYGAGKPIHIKTWLKDKWVCLSVADQGIGIAEDDQARILMQFERAVSGYAITGLGLGLYISNEIVKMHNGHILVQSELGKGATFILSLPKT